MKRVVFFVLGVLGPGGQQRLLLSILRGLNRDRWTPVVVGTQTVSFKDGKLVLAKMAPPQTTP